GRRLVGPFLHLDVEATVGAVLGRAEQPAAEPVQRDDLRAAGQPAALRDLGDGADLGVGALMARNEQDQALVGRVEREGDVHVREDDGVVERYQQEFHGAIVATGVEVPEWTLRMRPCAGSSSSWLSPRWRWPAAAAAATMRRRPPPRPRSRPRLRGAGRGSSIPRRP